MKTINKYRLIYYFCGIIILALGLTLNTKVNLGVSPILSVSLSISSIFNLDFANVTLVMYCIFVLVQLIIHFIQHREKKYLINDLLQIAFSVVFTRFLGLFTALIPTFSIETCGLIIGSLYFRVFMLIVAIVLTGIGAVLTLDMKLVPNPADGFVQALSTVLHKEIGLTKNIVDFSCIMITLMVCILFNHFNVIGINIGTIIAMVGVGRVMAIFNYFALKYLIKKANL